LKLKRNHKTILATFLLVLYAFIATPVSYWHHHKSTCQDDSTAQHSKVVKISQLEVDENCEICSHDYSASINDASAVYFYHITIHTTFSDFYTVKKIANPGYGQSNKGPPYVV
jgi:hypothetical protein